MNKLSYCRSDVQADGKFVHSTVVFVWSCCFEDIFIYLSVQNCHLEGWNTAPLRMYSDAKCAPFGVTAGHLVLPVDQLWSKNPQKYFEHSRMRFMMLGFTGGVWPAASPLGRLHLSCSCRLLKLAATGLQTSHSFFLYETRQSCFKASCCLKCGATWQRVWRPRMRAGCFIWFQGWRTPLSSVSQQLGGAI